jgi:hypothetical protein
MSGWVCVFIHVISCERCCEEDFDRGTGRKRRVIKEALSRVERAHAPSDVPGSIQSVGRLLGQAPQPFVEGDFAVDTAQGSHGAKSAEPIYPAIGYAAANEIFLDAIKGGPKISPLIFDAARHEQGASLDGGLLGTVVAEQKRLLGKRQRLAVGKLTITEAVDQGTEPGHVFENAEAGFHNLLRAESGMPETNRFKLLVRNDQAITAQAAKDADLEDVGTSGVMRVGQHQLGIPFVERLHLLGPAETDEVFLESEAAWCTGALLFDMHWQPILLAQAGDDFCRWHERVSTAQAAHWSRSKDARGFEPQPVVGEALGFEVRSRWDHGLLLFCRSAGVNRLRRYVPEVGTGRHFLPASGCLGSISVESDARGNLDR